MNRQQFLKNLRNSKVKLHPVPIDGWDAPIYLRPQTMGEIRDALMKPEEAPETITDVRGRLGKDPLFLARSLAKLVRDERGELLFDPADEEQMQELMRTMADAGPSISKKINEAYAALNSPNTEEVTPEGNSQSASSS